ncbi:hypothetical protein [Shinella zoogloeoides]|uniref:hypothetical protein n=1 Tax=Shinella zoogloeoides TaxID=352475 RepID=UPI000E646739|nr:hypothetical protein [Shinella zoogloeoides]
MKNFIRQPDGTHLPSAETLARVRANPHKYPDAVKDFARLSGKPEDLVQQMIDNPGSSGFWGTAGGIAVDIGQGAMNAGAIAAENLLPESILGDGANLVRDYAERLDPKFDTDKSVGEVIAEGAGQALPAVAATIGTGGWAGVAIGAGVGSLTFADEDNFANALNEIAPGVVPDILVVQPDDDEFTSTAKALVSNIVTDALFLGTVDVAGNGCLHVHAGETGEEDQG